MCLVLTLPRRLKMEWCLVIPLPYVVPSTEALSKSRHLGSRKKKQPASPRHVKKVTNRNTENVPGVEDRIQSLWIIKGRPRE